MLCRKCKHEIEDDSIYCRFCGKKYVTTPSEQKHAKRMNGTGNIYKMPGRRKKPYNVRMTIKGEDGKNKRVSLGYYEFKREAQMALEKAVNAGGPPPLFNITVAEARERWKEKHYPQLSDSGIRTYETAWNFFEPIKNMRMSEIKTAHIQSLIDDALARGLSKSSCDKIKHLASQLCAWAMQNDLINKNYASFVEIKTTEKAQKEAFTSEELGAIWNYYKATKNKDAACILIMCHTGFRINEFLALKKSDFYNGCLHGGSKTEKGKNRSVPVPDVMLPILEYLMEGDSEYVVANSEGGKYQSDNWRKRNYYKALKACGFPEELIKRRAPHSCRHTYATMCARLGVDDKALQDILGHEDISTTMNIYTHTDEEYLKNAAKNLNFLSEI